MIFAYVLLGLACLCVVLSVVLPIVIKKHRIWLFAGLVLLTVLCLQFALNSAYPCDFDGGEELSDWQLFVRIFSSTFQTFSLDADYVGILSAGEAAFAGSAAAKWIFNVLSCGLTVVAPATGGIAVLGMLCHFFPYLKLFILSFKRTKFVFSELNEYSVATAESIAAKKRYLKTNKEARLQDGEWDKIKSSVIVFTDAYTDDEAENSSELLERAKKIGAICLRDDISELKFYWLFRRSASKRIVYFLTDLNEEENLKTAVTLLAPKKRGQSWAKTSRRQFTKTQNMDMYVFTRNPEAVSIIKSAYDKFALSCSQGKKGQNLRYNVRYKTINEYKNLVYSLIDGYENSFGDINADRSYPLYWSLFKPQDGQNTGKTAECRLDKLSIVIVGGGKIGREFLKAAYWCGQMLARTEKVGKDVNFKPCKLKITMISVGALQTKRSLRFEMPEAFAAENYCKFNFIESEYATSEADGGGFDGKFKENCADADYVLVAFGDDDLNMQAASYVKRTLDVANLGNPKQVPVNYVIENGDMVSALLAHKPLEEQEKKNSGCILHPFGSVAQRYGYDNICLSELEKRAWNVNTAHEPEKREEDFIEFLKDEYARNSSMASALHYTYKLVSFNALKRKRLKIDDVNDIDCAAYKTQLYLLEHRRWCAYMRATGWRCPTAKQFFSFAVQKGENGEISFDSKSLELKLHSCLLESGASAPDGIAEINGAVEGGLAARESVIAEGLKLCSGAAEDMPLDKWLNSRVKFTSNKYDCLDALSFIAGNDFKDYDVKVVLNLSEDELKRVVWVALAKKDGGEKIKEIIRERGAKQTEKDGFKIYEIIPANSENYGIYAVQFEEKDKQKLLEALKCGVKKMFYKGMPAEKLARAESFAVVYCGVAVVAVSAK